MTAYSSTQSGATWRTVRREAGVNLYLSGAQGDAGALIGARVAGFPVELFVLPVSDWIDPQELTDAAAAVIQVDADSPASIKRFKRLAASTGTPLIAAAYEPPLALVRALLKAGAHDVLPLPLDIAELEASLMPVHDQRAVADRPALPTRNAKVVTIIKSVGGVGATALATQLAIRFARSEAAAGREACLIDLDVQFGDAAFQLGLRPRLTLADLFEAGSRLDGALLRSVTTRHESGLQLIGAPKEMMPLEVMVGDQLLEIVDSAKREFGTVFLELPTNWTNWTLSLMAGSDVVLLVTDLSVASLHRARRQLDLIAAQELGDLDVRVIVNRFDKSQYRTLGADNVRDALGREVAFTLVNDTVLMRGATERGVPIDEIKRKSQLGKDLDRIDAGLAEALGLER
ncbi:MAG: AAA family ATPase [Sphingomicrobium sp.]